MKSHPETRAIVIPALDMGRPSQMGELGIVVISGPLGDRRLHACVPLLIISLEIRSSAISPNNIAVPCIMCPQQIPVILHILADQHEKCRSPCRSWRNLLYPSTLIIYLHDLRKHHISELSRKACYSLRLLKFLQNPWLC
ncbi:hypothetical protein HD806DRAFT_551066 [Xylariaceae sp. AK1471]|nr:hypothetical protein HD806DRAFT_551066 [Xylariaceae sp. AK1471]